MQHRACPVLYENLERCDGAGGGREVMYVYHVCIPVADSYCYIAEANTIL